MSRAATDQHARRIVIDELGSTIVELASEDAARLRIAAGCLVVPAAAPGTWVVSDCTRVGSIALEDCIVEIKPKVPLASLVYMASVGGAQIDLGRAPVAVESSDDLPSALATALLDATAVAARAGLLKGYREVEESLSVVRGRWDVARQLKRSPGMPLPVELTYDDFTEDVVENRLLLTALLRLTRLPMLKPALQRRLRNALAEFASVTPLTAAPIASPPLDRRTQHYAHALHIARWVLESRSWSTEHGRAQGSAFLIEPAALFESFVGHALQRALRRHGVAVALQDPTWRLDAAGAVHLRPDILLRRAGAAIATADTKYKHYRSAPKNADVYQALAYAVGTGTRQAHLIYAGNEIANSIRIESLGITINVHVIDVGGTPDELRASVGRLSEQMLSSMPD